MRTARGAYADSTGLGADGQPSTATALPLSAHAPYGRFPTDSRPTQQLNPKLSPVMFTIQTYSHCGNYATPEPTDVEHGTLDYVLGVFDDWRDSVGRYSEESDAYAYLWKGNLTDVTDAYPDYELTSGPRGGIRRNRC